VQWVQGRWNPSPAEIDSARSAYLRSLRTIDRRIRKLVEIFRQRGRWENTLFVLTSDHGQAFLELDSLYHRFRVDEPIARVPLWIRTPGARLRGTRSAEWVSLIDVPRTIAAATGRDLFGDSTSRSLLETESSPGSRPVYCMTDGIPAKEAPTLSTDRRSFLDRLEIAAYRGNVKAVSREHGETRLYGASPTEAPAILRTAPSDRTSEEVAALAQQAVELALARVASHEYHGSVERRIAGWGY
jgi:arylsulfatase A-like enzyme